MSPLDTDLTVEWDATVIDQRPIAGGGVEWIVVHTNKADPTLSFQQSYQMTDTATAADVADKVRARLTVADAPKVLPPLDIKPVVKPAPDPVPVVDPVLVQFLSDLLALRQEVKAQELGLVTGTDVDALRKSVQNALTNDPTLLSRIF